MHVGGVEESCGMLGTLRQRQNRCSLEVVALVRWVHQLPGAAQTTPNLELRTTRTNRHVAWRPELLTEPHRNLCPHHRGPSGVSRGESVPRTSGLQGLPCPWLPVLSSIF